MARRTTRKELTRVFKDLTDEDRERVLDYARRLAKGSGGTNAPESLAPGDNGPSYTAAADRDLYEHKKEKAQRNDHPNDVTP